MSCGQRPANGDGIEFYLDLRPPSVQGRPVYDEDVLVLRVPAPGDEPGPAVWSSLDEAPADIGDLRFLSRREEGGYRVRLSVPGEFIRRRMGETVEGIGLDVGVNDADYGAGRDVQMMWCGFGENWLDASRFGCLVQERKNLDFRATVH